jgi:DNA-binding GntR family transcriptional regulator
MEGLLAQMAHYADEGNYEAWEHPHHELHACFHAHAGKRVSALIEQLSEHAQRYRWAYTVNDRQALAAAMAEHRRIVQACKNGDATEAASAVAEHLGHTAYAVIAAVDNSYDPANLRTVIAASSAAY